MAKKEKRFIMQEREGNPLTEITTMVLVDKETGVNYLWAQNGTAGGLTPLLDTEGKPIITKEA